MPLGQQSHSDTPNHLNQTIKTMKQNVSADKIRAKRRWVIRSSVTLSLTTVLLYSRILREGLIWLQTIDPAQSLGRRNDLWLFDTLAVSYLRGICRIACEFGRVLTLRRRGRNLA